MKKIKSILLVPAFVFALGLFPDFAMAATTTGTCSNQLDSGQAVSAGYGAVYNLFSAEKELIVKGTACANGNASVEVGSGKAEQYIYREGYRWDGTAWQKVAYTGSTAVNADWFAKSVTGTVPHPAGSTTFVVGYVCHWSGTVWHCGCKDTACAQPLWQAQAIADATTSPNPGASQAPSAELQSDRTNLSHTGSGYTSEYHLYAAGLDWGKPVGLILYTDGSGEYGLKNPKSSYLLGGTSGLIAVAKKHNMVLLTPLSPNKNCSDGEGSCWYLGDPPGYIAWAESLVASIESQYPINKKCVAVGGYSSGAEFSTSFWTGLGAAQRTMEDGVIVAISYGSSPGGKATTFPDAFKANVHINWNVGDADSDAHSAAQKGYDYYTKAGFQTSLDVIAGLGHNRDDFGSVMDAQITKHFDAACGSAAP